MSTVAVISNVQESENQDIPGRIIPDVKAGECYEFLCSMSTRAGHVHEAGSLLVVMDSTLATPHNEIGESGKNWICKTTHGDSVWATLEQCISRGWLKKVF